MRSSGPAALLAALILGLCGCPSSDESAGLEGDSSDATPIIPVDCTAACADTSTSAGTAVCYSCQCKAAMDGWLPSQDEYQCANGEEIVIYTAGEDGALTAVDADVTTCANPTLLYGTCTPGGRLGQLTHGTVTAKWICRRNQYVAGAIDDETLPYDDVGLILHNSRNGASCWFDDNDHTGIAGRNMPDIDLTKDNPENQAQFLGYYYYTDGKSCTRCHDNDPFNYTPYLQSVHWQAGAYTSSGFTRVALDSAPSGTYAENNTSHLVSAGADACTSCHRISSGATCSTWAPDSYGVTKAPGTEDRVFTASADANSPLWWLGTWMPYTGDGQPTPPDHEAWEARYGLARDTIQACCARPGVNTFDDNGAPVCEWEPTPTE